MTMDAPLRRALGLGAAKEGPGHWWAQRVTAIALVPLAFWFVVSVAFMAGGGHDTVRAWLAHPLVAVLMIALIIAMFYHAKLGLQVVIEDYVNYGALRLVLLMGNLFANFLLAVACVLAVVKITLGTT